MTTELVTSGECKIGIPAKASKVIGSAFKYGIVVAGKDRETTLPWQLPCRRPSAFYFYNVPRG